MFAKFAACYSRQNFYLDIAKLFEAKVFLTYFVDFANVYWPKIIVT